MVKLHGIVFLGKRDAQAEPRGQCHAGNAANARCVDSACNVCQQAVVMSSVLRRKERDGPVQASNHPRASDELEHLEQAGARGAPGDGHASRMDQ